MMTPAEIRMKQSPILSAMLLGMQQGAFIAESVLPRLPHALAGMSIPRLGDERLRRYNLRRAPGTATKRVDVKYQGVVYTVDQCAVEVPIPRELIREADVSARLDVNGHLDIARLAMVTVADLLALDYELDAAAAVTNPENYAAGHVATLAGDTKWSANYGMPVTDINNASNLIRKKTGYRANKLTLSPDSFSALRDNMEVRSLLPDDFEGGVSIEDLKRVFDLEFIEIGEAIWIDGNDVAQDVWGNFAQLSYTPKVESDGSNFSLAGQPAFGFTSVLEGHPMAEKPWFDHGQKAWIFGATYERRPVLGMNTAAVLFVNPK
jgi:hypothetical protein